MTIRVFGSSSCARCAGIVNGLKLLQMPFEYIDALADDQQDLCDQHDVGVLPHVQVLDGADVTWEKAEQVTLTEIVQIAVPRAVKK